MFGLVIVIISIAVFTYFMAAGSNYIDTDKLQSREVRARLNGAFSQYASGIIQFNLLFRKNPSSVSNISPSLIDPPKLPDNFSAQSLAVYNVTSVGERVGICLGVTGASYYDYLAVSDLKDEYPVGQIKITSDCSSLTEISAPISYPASFNVIYLIKI